LQRHLEARRAQGKGVAADAEGGSGSGCCGTVSSKWAKGTGGPAGDECYNLIAQPTAYRWQNDRDGLQQDDAVAALRASQGASGFHEINHPVIAQPVAIQAGAIRENPASGPDGVGVRTDGVAYTIEARAEVQAVGQPVPYDLFQITAPVNRQNRAPGDPCHTLAKDNAAHAAVAFHPTQDPISNTDGSTHCMGTGSSRGDATIAVAQSMTVRRLTNRECERLQGFPDDWTMIPYRGKPAEQCPDGPRYKALGNSMACNCMAWIGERIAAYENHNP
jgi:DNA (cytosine-5)-methyltransferase 1